MKSKMNASSSDDNSTRELTYDSESDVDSEAEATYHPMHTKITCISECATKCATLQIAVPTPQQLLDEVMNCNADLIDAAGDVGGLRAVKERYPMLFGR